MFGMMDIKAISSVYMLEFYHQLYVQIYVDPRIWIFCIQANDTFFDMYGTI